MCFIFYLERDGIQNIFCFNVYSQPELDIKFIRIFAFTLRKPATSFCRKELSIYCDICPMFVARYVVVHKPMPHI